MTASTDMTQALLNGGGDGTQGPPVIAGTEPTVSESGAFEPRLIHFLEDGFTAFGVLWYRGQTMLVDEVAYKGTKGTDGTSWLDRNRGEQYEAWGRQMFDDGPWPYSKYEDPKAQAAEDARAGRPPRLDERPQPQVTTT